MAIPVQFIPANNVPLQVQNQKDIATMANKTDIWKVATENAIRESLANKAIEETRLQAENEQRNKLALLERGSQLELERPESKLAEAKAQALIGMSPEEQKSLLYGESPLDKQKLELQQKQLEATLEANRLEVERKTAAESAQKARDIYSLKRQRKLEEEMAPKDWRKASITAQTAAEHGDVKALDSFGINARTAGSMEAASDYAKTVSNFITNYKDRVPEEKTVKWLRDATQLLIDKKTQLEQRKQELNTLIDDEAAYTAEARDIAQEESMLKDATNNIHRASEAIQQPKQAGWFETISKNAMPVGLPLVGGVVGATIGPWGIPAGIAAGAGANELLNLFGGKK
jgi:hypothetical protein